MQRVLVTGCLGYIGSILSAELLNCGYTVIGVDNCRYNNAHVALGLLGHRGFRFLREDVSRLSCELENHIRTADIIIPLAALVGAPVCDNFPVEATKVNLDAITKLTSICGPHQRIIYPNTNSGYGQTDGTSSVNEIDELKPISRYARDKCLAEARVLSSAAKSTVFRLATVFGVSPRMRMDLLVNDFTRRLLLLLKERQLYTNRYHPGPIVTLPKFFIFDPHFMRNFVHVRDVARAFIFAIEHKLDGVYNLGHPDANLSKIQLAHHICDHHVYLEKEAIEIGEGKDPDQRNYIVSNEKILSTGFKFEHSLNKGIREVLNLCHLMSQEETNKMRNV